jgi:hypothetical protein
MLHASLCGRGIVLVFLGGEHYVAMVAGCCSMVGGGQLADKRSSGLPGPCTVLSLVLSLPCPFAPHVEKSWVLQFWGSMGMGDRRDAGPEEGLWQCARCETGYTLFLKCAPAWLTGYTLFLKCAPAWFSKGFLLCRCGTVVLFTEAGR